MAAPSRITSDTLLKKKRRNEKIVALTAYDFFTARLLNEVDVDIILVGDSLGMVILGYENTLPVNMDEMVHHAKAVVRGNSSALVVGDMPFMSYSPSVRDAVRNAGRFVKEAGVEAVKLEGGADIRKKVQAILKAGIPVLGHLGLTPQSVLALGGYKVQGRDTETAARLLNDALLLEKTGVFAIVLECVPPQLAKTITERLTIPTIGIGAGKWCDGQIMVTHDLLGMSGDFKPKFVKRYADIEKSMKKGITRFKEEVKKGSFPNKAHSY